MPASVRSSGAMNPAWRLPTRRLRRLSRGHVQAALFGVGMFPPPATGPLVLARLHGARAGTAADAGIAAIVQRVVRHVVRSDVLPDVVVGPVGERVNLHEGVGSVPLDFVNRRACDGLLASETGHPC